MLVALKEFIEKIDVFVEKFEKDMDLTQDEIELCKKVATECETLKRAIYEELPRNMYHRNYRKDPDGKYVRDDNGDYIGIRGIGGELWYRHKNQPTVVGETKKKFIGPFGG